jgi:ribonuclease T
MNEVPIPARMAQRFRGFLPVVVDVETGGFDSARHALLEIAVQPILMDDEGWLRPGHMTSTHVIPFPGSLLDPKSLEITGIDPYHPFRAARDEKAALDHVFAPVRAAARDAACQRAILVGHNAFFDLGFINAAVARTSHKRNPFHPFSTFDTVTLAGMAYGQTVLSRAVQAAGMDWNTDDAHSAIYDTERTAQLFCKILNRWHAAQTGRAIPDERPSPNEDPVPAEIPLATASTL